VASGPSSTPHCSRRRPGRPDGEEEGVTTMQFITGHASTLATQNLMNQELFNCIEHNGKADMVSDTTAA
jgi:hypothetical protein